jgi:hypothetical protein
MNLEKIAFGLQSLVRKFNSSSSNDIIPVLDLCESPLEQWFVYFLFDFFRLKGNVFEYVKDRYMRIIGGKYVINSIECIILPQYQIENCWVDFAVIKKTRHREKGFAIECDSFQFHSKEHEKSRDRIRRSIYERNGWEAISYPGHLITPPGFASFDLYKKIMYDED